VVLRRCKSFLYLCWWERSGQAALGSQKFKREAATPQGSTKRDATVEDPLSGGLYPPAIKLLDAEALSVRFGVSR